MTPRETIFTLICVVAISCGQLLFKKAGTLIPLGGISINLRASLVLGLALVLYSSATLLWVYLLRTVDLSKAYILMALSFVIVPLGSFILFGERLTSGYLLGIFMIIAGIIVATRIG